MKFKVCFHGDLDFFLKTGSGIKNEFFSQRCTPVKDVIESMGVPHTEIGAIMAEGEERDFGFLPREGMCIQVFPVTPPLDITRPTCLRPEPFGKVLFVADVNVGKLARLLRIAGFDTAYKNTWSDSTIASVASREERVVLTKDRNLLKRKVITYGRLIRSIRPWDQLEEVIDFFGLREQVFPFRRCPSCNVPLQRIPKTQILDRIEPLTRLFFDEFHLCPECERIYWPGSHYYKIIRKLEKLEKQ
ncbi:MAG: hypothetical protein JW971_00760 [Synergistales bacterium]|nr:hypothetical protein [Synergistales bacterium]